MGRYARIVLLTALVTLQAACGVPDFFYGSAGYWQRALSYSFFHANWWHLAVNALALWTIYNPQRKCKACRDFILPYIIAVLVYPLSLRPVIGFSNVLYACLGLRTPSLRRSWWRQPAVILFIVLTALMVFIPRISATTHLAAFALGVMLAALHRTYLKVTEDARRYL